MAVVRPNIHSTDHFIRTKDISRQERILLTKGNQYLTNAEPETGKNRTVAVNDPISISPEARELQKETPESTGLSHAQGLECCRMTLLRNVLERFIGRSVPILSSNTVVEANQPETTAGGTPGETTPTPTVSESLMLSLEYSKTETVGFSTTGSFQTRDGQEVSFSLELNFTRQVLAEQSLSANFAQAIRDPFTVHYNGLASQITQASFSFTIDCCRPGEEIVPDNMPAEETGNPAAEDAAEGEETAEVAATENTEAAPVEGAEETAAAPASDFFDRLRVWAKDGFGQHRPVMFGVKGVGVMFHENQGLEFTLKKLGHFLNKMAKIADRFSQTQELAENEDGPAVSSQA